MAHISDTLASLSGGVSQRPPRLRHPSQASEVVNGWATVAGGVAKRPPLNHVATLSEDPSGYTTGLVEHYVRDSDSRFRVVIAGGDLKVFDAETGTEQTVHFPDGKGYLSGPGGFRTVAVGDRMWILNQGRTIEALEDRAPLQEPRGLIYIRQSDYGTRYEIQLDGRTMYYTTPSGNSPNDRERIDTTNVARAFLERLRYSYDYFGLYFEGEQYGSTIVIRRKDGRDFRLTGSDGLADRGMVVVKGSVQTFEDLPSRAPNGLVVEVAGDPGTGDDNYWVRYDDRGSPEKDGVWRETAKPGTRTHLDPSTMPHHLQYRGAFMDPVEVQTFPPEPVVGPGDVSEATSPWTDRGVWEDENSEPILEQTDQDITEHREFVQASIPAGYAGQRRQVSASYSLDTAGMVAGSRVLLNLYQVSPGEPTVVARRMYQGGSGVHHDTLDTEVVVPPGGATYRLLMEYSQGETPQEMYRRANLLVWGYNAGLRHYSWDSQELQIPDGGLYPVGWEVEVTVGGSVYEYVIEDQPLRAHAVATELAALIPGATAQGTRVRIPTTEAVEASLAWSDETHLYAGTALNLPPDAYVGLTVRNLTDRSEGTIERTVGGLVVVTGLAGGERNRFEAGDECEITETGDYFVFRRSSWAPREAGDEERCPFPSFVGWKGREVFFVEDRLGITAGGSVVLSRSGDHTAFVRQSARVLLDSDVIDVESSGRRTAEFHTAIEWDQGLFLLSDLGLYRLGGDPFLSPRSVSLGLVAELPNDPDVRPVVAGSRIYFVRRGVEGVQVLEASVRQNLRVAADNLTVEIPTYIQGAPKALAVDPALGVLALLTSAGLYVYTYHDEPGHGRILSAWSRWEIPEGAVDVSLLDGVLSVVTVRGSGVYLGEINLSGELPTGPQDYQDTVGPETLDYGFTYEFTPIHVRNEYGKIIPGDLRVQYVEVHYHDTTGLTLQVSPEGRQTYTYTEEASVASEGTLRAPVGAKDYTLTLTDHGRGPCAVSSLDWEGIFYPRQHPRLRQER